MNRNFFKYDDGFIKASKNICALFRYCKADIQTRYALQYLLYDEEGIAATNGRILFVLKTGAIEGLDKGQLLLTKDNEMIPVPCPSGNFPKYKDIFDDIKKRKTEKIDCRFYNMYEPVRQTGIIYKIYNSKVCISIDYLLNIIKLLNKADVKEVKFIKQIEPKDESEYSTRPLLINGKMHVQMFLEKRDVDFSVLIMPVNIND